MIIVLILCMIRINRFSYKCFWGAVDWNSFVFTDPQTPPSFREFYSPVLQDITPPVFPRPLNYQDLVANDILELSVASTTPPKPSFPPPPPPPMLPSSPCSSVTDSNSNYSFYFRMSPSASVLSSTDSVSAVFSDASSDSSQPLLGSHLDLPSMEWVTLWLSSYSSTWAQGDFQGANDFEHPYVPSSPPYSAPPPWVLSFKVKLSHWLLGGVWFAKYSSEFQWLSSSQ